MVELNSRHNFSKYIYTTRLKQYRQCLNYVKHSKNLRNISLILQLKWLLYDNSKKKN